MFEFFFTLLFGFLAAMIVKAVAINVWVQLTWKAFGWKPKLIRQDILDNTAMFCASHLVQHELSLHSAPDSFTPEEIAVKQREFEGYARWAIECYVEKYLTLGRVTYGETRAPDPRIAVTR